MTMAEELLEKEKDRAEDPGESLDLEPGVLAGVEISDEDDAELDEKEKAALKDLRQKATKRDYPARLTEVIAAWESALFYRGYQFLLPRRGGGWSIPGEDSGWGASMQADLSLLPTNIYSSYGQMLIAALTRQVPGVQFQPMDAASAVDITGAEAADKFIQVIQRNNDLMATQTDAARYCWTDGRFHYWTRFVKDGQRFGWEDEDAPEVVPEDEPPAAEGKEGREAPDLEDAGEPKVDSIESTENDASEDEAFTPSKRKPRGQEVRTCYGKLSVKVPMMADDQSQFHFLQFSEEVDVSTAKGMFPRKADKIKGGGSGISEGEIDRLARVNTKLGMQASYVTSDSISDDVTITRTWLRPAALMSVKDKGTRNSLLEKFPDGVLVTYAGEVFCYARNESMDWSWTTGHAFSGDGQGRNSLGTSLLPIQKRLNNWLDLMNDTFIRCVPKKWMNNRAFNVEAIKDQTNVPGDIGGFEPQPGLGVNDLIFVEPNVNPPVSLAEFVKEYSGELAQLLTGAFPALFGGNTGSNDTASGIGIQRDAALGRIAPTWHALKSCEAQAMKQGVRWGAKCRDKSINESIPGTEAVIIEVNDLNANILAFGESDENFPESYTAKQQRMMVIFQDASKNQELAEVLYNTANLELVQNLIGLSDMYIPQVASRNKQLAEIDMLLRSQPVPSQEAAQAQSQIAQMKMHGVDPQLLATAEQQLAQLPPDSSIPIDAEIEDNDAEAQTCLQWLLSPEGRKAKRDNPEGFANVRFHYLDHKKAAAAAAPPPKSKVVQSINFKDLPPSGKIQEAAEAGIQLNPQDVAPPPVLPGAAATGAPTPPNKIN
jgi:hypothetical protein